MTKVFKKVGRGMLLPELSAYRVWLDAQISMLKGHNIFLGGFLAAFRRKYKTDEVAGLNIRGDVAQLNDLIWMFEQKKNRIQHLIDLQKSKSGRKKAGVYY